MRKVILALVGLLVATIAASAQDSSGQPLKGVNPPIETWPKAPGAGKSGAAKSGKLPGLQAPNYGRRDGGPISTVPGRVTIGTTLPGDIHPIPIDGRPGYGAAVVNGKRVIVDMDSNRVFQTPE
jgi:hypothetical protein